MDKKKAIVVEPIDESGLRLLAQNGRIETVYLKGLASAEAVAESLTDAAAVMVRRTRITRVMLENAPKMELISKHGVGYDNVDVAAATDLKIPVTITPGANSDSVAELTMAMMLSLSRNMLSADADLKTGRFTQRGHYGGVELGKKTAGIVGLGRIGSRVARKCSSGFGMRVLAYDPFVHDEYAKRFDVELTDDLGRLLQESDYVTIHTPLTAQTSDMIGDKELALMKKDAFILNTARGGIINEEALYRALTDNRIRGAGLDVFLQEPPRPGEAPLLELKNVIVTPHLGAASREAGINMASMAAEEIIRVLGGKKPKYPINPEIYNEYGEVT